MIIKDISRRKVFIICFLFIFPFIQKQWFNLHLFNVNNFSLNSLLYYISGGVWPLIISFISLNSFTYYKFNSFEGNCKYLVNGKKLLFLVFVTLIPLSFLFSIYIQKNVQLFFSLFFDKTYFSNIDAFQHFLFIFLTSTLLLFNKSRLLIKKLILINFFTFSSLIWFCKVNSDYLENRLSILEYTGLHQIENINIVLLFSIECFYFLWSLISNNNNLSNWSLKIASKNEILPLLYIIFFYLLMFIYYSILD